MSLAVKTWGFGLPCGAWAWAAPSNAAAMTAAEAAKRKLLIMKPKFPETVIPFGRGA